VLTVVGLAVALGEAHAHEQLLHLVLALLLPRVQLHRHIARVDDGVVHRPVPHQRKPKVVHRPARDLILSHACMAPLLVMESV